MQDVKFIIDTSAFNMVRENNNPANNNFFQHLDTLQSRHPNADVLVTFEWETSPVGEVLMPRWSGGDLPILREVARLVEAHYLPIPLERL